MKVPNDLQYTDNHEWLRLDGESASLGITQHLQELLGSLIAIQLPMVGTPLVCGQAAATLQSESSTHVILSPLSGTVTKINTLVTDRPGIINVAPYGEGWLFQLRMEAGEEIEHLRDPKTYRAKLALPEPN